MSRRTKFIIAALFLVLLAVPTAYVALTWHPENPLRFRVVKVHPPHVDEWGGGTVHVLDLEIKNTSSVPVRVYLASMTVRKIREHESISEDKLGAWLKIDGNESAGEVPAHGVLKGSLVVLAEQVEPATRGELQMFYNWMSRTKHSVQHWCEKLRNLSPQKFQSSIPEVTSYGADLAPLEPLHP